MAAAMRYLLLVFGLIVYSALVYLASLDFQDPSLSSLPHGSLALLRHVVLIPGLIPLVITAIWAAYPRQKIPRIFGLALITVSIVLHYIVVAISAHADNVYPWAQLVEFLYAGISIYLMVRRVTSKQPDSPIPSRSSGPQT